MRAVREFVKDFAPLIAGLVVLVLIVVGIGLWIDSSNDAVDEKIQACLAQGGTPIVVGHQYTSEFKGCGPPDRVHLPLQQHDSRQPEEV